MNGTNDLQKAFTPKGVIREIEYKNHKASISYKETEFVCDWIYGCHSVGIISLSSEYLNTKSGQLKDPDEMRMIADIYERYFKQVIDGL